MLKCIWKLKQISKILPLEKYKLYMFILNSKTHNFTGMFCKNKLICRVYLCDRHQMPYLTLVSQFEIKATSPAATVLLKIAR